MNTFAEEPVIIVITFVRSFLRSTQSIIHIVRKPRRIRGKCRRFTTVSRVRTHSSFFFRLRDNVGRVVAGWWNEEICTGDILAALYGGCTRWRRGQPEPTSRSELKRRRAAKPNRLAMSTTCSSNREKKEGIHKLETRLHIEFILFLWLVFSLKNIYLRIE